MGFINNFLSHFFEERTHDFVVRWLTHEQVPDGLGLAPLDPDGCYLRVHLRSMRVVHVQRGIKRFYGMVNSHVALAHLAEGEAEFQAVVAPPELKDVDAKDLDRYLSFNQPLAGPVPYRGGDVGIQVGLFSVESANLLDPYVKLLEEISKQCSVEFINVALPYAGLLAKGVGLLTGTSNAKSLEIGASTTFDPMSSGWLLIMRADRDQFPDERLGGLSVGRDDFKIMEGNRPIKDYPYMLLRFSGDRKRADWSRIPELRAQHALFRQALRSGEANEITPALLAFERYAHTCPDLLQADAIEIAAKARADVERLYPSTETSAELADTAGARAEPLSLDDYDIYAGMS